MEKDFSNLRMTVNILGEHGKEYAYYGMSLSYGLVDNYNDFRSKLVVDDIKTGKTLWDRLIGVSDRLFNRDNGENKFLESMAVWIEIDAPRYWWQEFDTYRVGMSKQSESTMHTISKRLLTQDDFVEDVDQESLDVVNRYIVKFQNALNPIAKYVYFRKIKINLPEGFLQRRVVTTNYKTLRHIVDQRNKHRLIEWHLFIHEICGQIELKKYILPESKREQEKEE
jgi:hypothetical protein